MQAAMKNPRVLIGLLCIGGVALSGVSLYNHYSLSATEYCDFDELFNCDLVNRSSYARILGVPVALIGLLGFGALLASLLVSGGAVWSALRFCASLVGLAFATYLALVEGFVLHTWCVLCLGSLVMIIGVSTFSGVNWWREWADAA
jgi:uncharacterized membrane protein